MDCEICGAEDAGYTAIIEGARLTVCGNCARGGKIISYPQRQSVKPGAPGEPPRQIVRKEIEVVEDYGQKIRGARMKVHLPLAVLAERINEKESFLERVEQGKTLPSEALCRKLERELGISLLEESDAVSSGGAGSNGGKGKGVTIGDIIELAKKKKGK